MRGKTVLVTGGTSGIGFQTARALALQGARVLITGRNAERGAAAVATLAREAGHDALRFIRADAASLAGNRALASALLGHEGRLDVLVNNLGGLYADRWTTPDGHEATLAMNVLAPFALTEAVLPLLRSTSGARVVNLASSAHAMWRGDPFVDLQAERSYVGMQIYARAKLLNILWSLALAERLRPAGITVNAVNPGMAWTDMTGAMAPRLFPWWLRPAWPLLRLAQRRASPSAASRSSVRAAVDPALASTTGAYLESDGRLARASALASSLESAEKTWSVIDGLAH